MSKPITPCIESEHTAGVLQEQYEPSQLLLVEHIKEHSYWYLEQFNRFNFCPDCGADLREIKLVTKDGKVIE